MLGFTRVPSQFGWKAQSRRGKVFISLGADVYRFFVDVYGLAISLERSLNSRKEMRKNGR